MINESIVMKKLSVLSLAILPIFLGGCALFSPSYTQPDIGTPQIMRNGMAVESGESDFSQLEWWKKVNDPQLNKLITMALANNNQIQMGMGNIMQAQASLKAAQYAWIPSLNAGVGGFSGNSWGTNFTPQGGLANTMPSGSMANTGFSGYDGSFMPSYSFNVFRNIVRKNWLKPLLQCKKRPIIILD